MISTNLTDFFIKEFEISLPNDLTFAVSSVSGQYNGEKITSEEIAREQLRNERIAMYKKKFVDLPHMEIQLESRRFSYDTRNITALDDYGTVYQVMQISGP